MPNVPNHSLLPGGHPQMSDIATTPKLGDTVLSYIDEAAAGRQGAIPQRLIDEATSILSEKQDPQTGLMGPKKVEDVAIVGSPTRMANVQAVIFEAEAGDKQGVVALYREPFCKTADGFQSQFELSLVAKGGKGQATYMKPFTPPHPVDIATLPECDSKGK
jgi:hypothetical protein